MRVLLIEDERDMLLSLEMIMKSAGFTVDSTELGEDGIDLGKVFEYDIIVLDLTLPDMPGSDVLRKLRMARVRTPVLILTATSDVDQKVKLLGVGADDYMTKPFYKGELIARIQAIVRRANNHPESLIRTGTIVLNLDAKTVEVAGQRVHLTSKEYQMLELLSLRKGTTLTKEMFLNHLYNGMDDPELKIIDVFICKLRKKLRDSGGGEPIETVWGRGYVLRDPPESSKAA
jgi:two-component system, cell cycle response regulator CtrA